MEIDYGVDQVLKSWKEQINKLLERGFEKEARGMKFAFDQLTDLKEINKTNQSYRMQRVLEDYYRYIATELK